MLNSHPIIIAIQPAYPARISWQHRRPACIARQPAYLASQHSKRENMASKDMQPALIDCIGIKIQNNQDRYLPSITVIASQKS
jgi:hypothetical protein